MDASPPKNSAPSGDPTPDDGQRRRRIIVITLSAVAVAAVVAMLVVGLLNQGVGTSIQDALATGERPEAPALKLPVLQAGDGIGPVGSTLDLTDLRGSVVVLNFWASWCPPCKAEGPILEGIARGYRERDEKVVVLGVDVEDLPSSALKFIRDLQVSYPNVRDGTDATKLAFQVGSLPETFVIDQDGSIALKKIGQVTEPEQLTNAVEQVLTEGAKR